MTHQFTLHQTVRLKAATVITQLSHDGLYEVTRLMPADVAGIFSYRLKSAAGERIAVEHDLVDVGS